MVAVDIRSIVPITVEMALAAHEQHRRAVARNVESPGHTRLGARIAVAAAAEARHKMPLIAASIVKVAALIVRAHGVGDGVPRVGIAAITAERIADQPLDIAHRIRCSQDAWFGGWDGAGNAFYEPWTQADGRIYINVPQWSVTMSQKIYS